VFLSPIFKTRITHLVFWVSKLGHGPWEEEEPSLVRALARVRGAAVLSTHEMKNRDIIMIPY
jgi:hypothetical protein